MPWVAQDDHYFHNPKARAVGPLGRELFSASWCYCSIQLNDGLFVTEDVQVIAALAQVQPDIADLLYSHDMWHPEETDCAKCRAVGQTMPVPAGHVAVHEYLKQNKTREQVIAEREAAAERQRKSRASRRDSHDDFDRSNGVTSAAPVPSHPPDDKHSSRRPGNSQGTSPPVDNPDDDGFFAAVFDQFAQLKLDRQPAGKVNDPVPWKRKTAENARTELADQAQRWRAEYDVTPGQLASALLTDQAPPSHYRRKDQP